MERRKNLVMLRKKAIYLFSVFFVVSLISVILFGQEKLNNCDVIKNGTFYYYHAQKEYIITRKGSKQIEVDLTTGDTAFFETTWLNDCLLNLKSLKSSKPNKTIEELFVESHPVNVKIIKVEKAYYTFHAVGEDPSLSKYFIEDTIWFKPR